jgi:lysozyme
VSRYQAPIDWATARANGVSFAFIKATEGGDRVDSGFVGHWRGAGAAGVARGAYHFFYFCTPAEVQARWFIANVPKERGMLPPVVDLEWNPQSPTCTYRPPPEVVRAEALTFMDLLERHYGQRPIIYTDPASSSATSSCASRGRRSGCAPPRPIPPTATASPAGPSGSTRPPASCRGCRARWT